MARRRNGNGNGNGHGYSGAASFGPGAAAAVGSQIEGVIRDIALLQAAQDQQEDEVRDLRQYVSGQFANVATKLDGLAGQMAARDRVNYPMIWGLCVGGFGVVATLVGAAYFLTSQQTQVLVQPIQLETRSLAQSVESVRDAISLIDARVRDSETAVRGSAEKDARSEADRESLNRRTESLQEATASNAATLREIDARFSTQLVEVETQFRALSEIENARWNAQERTNGIIWERVFSNSRYPDRPAFNPNIAREIGPNSTQRRQ